MILKNLPKSFFLRIENYGLPREKDEEIDFEELPDESLFWLEKRGDPDDIEFVQRTELREAMVTDSASISKLWEENQALQSRISELESTSVKQEQWVRVEERLPTTEWSVWFYSPIWKCVKAGRFYALDSFERENVFISSDGGHFMLHQVSHWQPNKPPEPPSTDKI